VRCGRAEERFDPQIKQEQAADEANWHLNTDEEVCEKGETESGDDAVKSVCGGDAQPGDETREPPMRERAADGEDADGSDGRGDGYADEEAAKEQSERSLSLFILYGLEATRIA
jgi:hypothetical protein